MTSSLYKAQLALKLCEKHEKKKELHAFCKTCKMKICSTCIKEDHTSHDWETITDILREKRQSLPEECKEIRAKQLSGLKKEIDRFDRKIQEEDTSFDQNKSALNRSRQSYIDGINKLFNDKIEECHENSKTTVQIYTEKRDGLKQKVEYLDKITLALDNDINTLPDHDILDMELEMRNELDKALSYSADKYTCTTLFVPGQINMQTMKDMIGDIHCVSLEEKNDFGSFPNIVASVKPTSEKKKKKTNVWVRVYEDNYFKLLDKTGEELKTMKTPGTDLIISNSGEFILTHYKKCIISVLTQDEKKIKTVDTKPLYPSYISKTDNDDILLTLVDGGDLYNLVPTSRRVVQRMSLTGKVLHTYEFREDDKTRLFTLPMKTTENKNTDVYVVNRTSIESGELVLLHKDGHVKFTYRGEGLKSDKFRPFDVQCDSKCRILLTERYSRAIHMLSAEGMYLCTLCQYEQIHPTVISIHGNNLWCGFHEGRVKVFRYIK